MAYSEPLVLYQIILSNTYTYAQPFVPSLKLYAHLRVFNDPSVS